MKPAEVRLYLYYHGKLVASAFLALILAVVCWHQTTLAASGCQSYYKVRYGDNVAYISQSFGFRWGDIASANYMQNFEKPAIGQVLCIPTSDLSTRPTPTHWPTYIVSHGIYGLSPINEPNSILKVTVSRQHIYATLSDFLVDHTYRVKTRNVDIDGGGWYELEQIQISKDATLNISWPVPFGLRNTPTLNVCFKDQITNELICRSAFNR